MERWQESEGHGIALQVEKEHLSKSGCAWGGENGREGSYGERDSGVSGLNEELLWSRRCFYRTGWLHKGHQHCQRYISSCARLCTHPSSHVPCSTVNSLAFWSFQISHATTPPPFLHEDFMTASRIVFPSSTYTISSIATSATSASTTPPPLPN
jgi:hypothetical protein